VLLTSSCANEKNGDSNRHTVNQINVQQNVPDEFL